MKEKDGEGSKLAPEKGPRAAIPNPAKSGQECGFRGVKEERGQKPVNLVVFSPC